MQRVVLENKIYDQEDLICDSQDEKCITSQENIRRAIECGTPNRSTM
jgi:hypothetical protein